MANPPHLVAEKRGQDKPSKNSLESANFAQLLHICQKMRHKSPVI